MTTVAPLRPGVWTAAGAVCGLALVALVYLGVGLDGVGGLHRRFPVFFVLDAVPFALALVGVLIDRLAAVDRELASARRLLGAWGDGALADVVLDAALLADADGAVVAANRAAESLFARSDLRGVPVGALLPGLLAAGESRPTERVGVDGRSLGLEWRIGAVRARGDIVQVDVACGPASGRRVVYVLRRVQEDRGAVGRVPPVDPESPVLDVSPSVPAPDTSALVRERDEARELNRAKGAFLANLSHELRTPLNAILGYSDLVAEELGDHGLRLDAELDAIRRSTRHLLSLVNGVLDLSKIEAGRLSVVLEPVPILPIVEDVKATLVPLARANGNALEVHVDPSVHVVRGDETRLRQVLINLVGNACKFTKDGHVTLAVRYEPDAGDVAFEVTDTGIGMTPEQLGRLFREYVQADSKIQKKYGGTGLGLALSRRLVELMGGTITVTSELGTGSTFTVRLPFGSTQHTLLPDMLSRTSPSTPPPGAPIVLVDRHAAPVRDRLYKALVAAGLPEVVWPSDLSPGALAALNPRAIVLDTEPGEPLLEALALAAELEGVPIVGLSDDEPTMDPNQRVAWLTRPLDPRVLLPVLRQADRSVSGCAVVGVGPDAERVSDALRRRGWQVALFTAAGAAADEVEGRRIAFVAAVGDPVPSGFGGAPVVWITHRSAEGAIPLLADPDALVDLVEFALYRQGEADSDARI